MSLRHANEGLLAHPLLVCRRLLPGEGVPADRAKPLEDDVRISTAVDDVQQHVDEREAQKAATQTMMFLSNSEKIKRLYIDRQKGLPWVA